jgi:hypothetical protein
MKQKRKSAAEKIADLIGFCIKDVKECVYQPCKYYKPKVYSIGNYYFCATDHLPAYSDFYNWEKKTTFRGDFVWQCNINS